MESRQQGARERRPRPWLGSKPARPGDPWTSACSGCFMDTKTVQDVAVVVWDITVTSRRPGDRSLLLLRGCKEVSISSSSLWSESRSVVSDSLQPHGLYSPWNSPGQDTGVGSCSLLRRPFQPRDRIQVSCITGGFFTSWAARAAPYHSMNK